MSFKILKDSWCSYLKMVKAEKTKHFSDTIISICHKPRVLFSAINAILICLHPACPIVSSETCKTFLGCFVDNIVSFGLHILLHCCDPSITVTCYSPLFNQFEPVSLLNLLEIIGHMKLSACLTDVISTHLFKDIGETIVRRPLVTWMEKILWSGHALLITYYCVAMGY